MDWMTDERISAKNDYNLMGTIEGMRASFKNGEYEGLDDIAARQSALYRLEKEAGKRGLIEKGKWHGTNIRGAAYFSYNAKSASADIHPPQFEAVVKRLEELSRTLDGNGQPIVKFVFTRYKHDNPVVAYHWTSEWADNKFDRELVELGGSLGRGIWDPWKDSYTFDEYVR